MAMRNICMLLLIIRRIGDVVSDTELFNATEGSVVRLLCNCTTNQDPEWRYKDDYIFLAGAIAAGVDTNRFFVTSSSKVSTLLIKNVSLSDSGLYRCIEEDGVGKVHMMQLLVSESEMAVLTSNWLTTLTVGTQSDAGHADNTGAVAASVCVVTLVVIVASIVTFFLCRKAIKRRQPQREQQPASAQGEEVVLLDRRQEHQPCLQRRASSFKPFEEIDIGHNLHFLYAIAELENLLYVVLRPKNSPDEHVSEDLREEFHREKLCVIGSQLTGHPESQIITEKPEITIPGMTSLVDIVACREKRCLYIAGFINPYAKGRVWRMSLQDLQPEAMCVDPFLPKNGDDYRFNPHSLSVRSGQLLVTSSKLEEVMLYDYCGVVIKLIPLPGRDPVHAVETARTTFIVCCLKPCHAVCEFNGSGNELRVCDSQFNSPYYMTLDSEERVFVADENNHRIVLLRADLSEKEILDCTSSLSETSPDEIWPWQLCYVELTNELLVSVAMSDKLHRFRRVLNECGDNHDAPNVHENELNT